VFHKPQQTNIRSVLFMDLFC